MFAFCSIPCLLIGFMMFSKAFVVDFESVFVQIDRLTDRRSAPSTSTGNFGMLQTKNAEIKMLEHCKEVVDLHQKMNRYCMHSDNF